MFLFSDSKSSQALCRRNHSSSTSMIPQAFNRFVGEMHVTGSHRSQSVKNEACTQIALWSRCSSLTPTQRSELFSLGQQIKDGPSLKRRPRSSSSVTYLETVRPSDAFAPHDFNCELCQKSGTWEFTRHNENRFFCTACATGGALECLSRFVRPSERAAPKVQPAEATSLDTLLFSRMT